MECSQKPVQHELNEAPKAEIPAPEQDSYNPTDSENRRAYSAQYIVRVIKRLEEDAKKSLTLAARLATLKKADSSVEAMGCEDTDATLMEPCGVNPLLIMTRKQKG